MESIGFGRSELVLFLVVGFLTCQIWIIVICFKESMRCGLMGLFIPLYSLYYAVTRWAKAKWPLLIQLALLLPTSIISIVVDWGMMDIAEVEEEIHIVAEINGRKVTLEEYKELYRSVGKDSWQILVSEVLLDLEIEKRKISVADEKIQNALFSDPPYVVQSLSGFQDDEGRFDVDVYRRALQDTTVAMRELRSHLEASVRKTLLNQELQAQLVSELGVAQAAKRERSAAIDSWFTALKDRATVKDYRFRYLASLDSAAVEYRGP